MKAKQPSARRAKTQDAKSAKSFATQDSFVNYMTHTGLGSGNQGDAGMYAFRPITRVRQQIEWAYRGSWIVGRAVDTRAEDMTREGVEIITDDAPDRIAEFEKHVAALQVWGALCQTQKWARLYGGALAFMMIEDQDPATPLRLETLRQGQFKGLLPLDRWVVTPSLSDLVDEYGPMFGMPRFYDTVADSGGIPRMRIHYSRVLRFEGVRLPYWQKISENLWSQSVLERLWDRLLAFDSTSQGVAQLVYKAHLRTLKMKNLRTILAGNAQAEKAVQKQVAIMRYNQTNEGITVIDADDSFEAHAYTFTGLDAVMAQQAEQLAGATRTPLVMLFGQSPAGFSTGDADIRNYQESIANDQATDMAAPVDILYRVAYRSFWGRDTPEVWALKFRPLWKMTDGEKADVAVKKTTAVTQAYDAQLLTQQGGMKELKQMANQTGMFSNIQDEDIEAAKAELAPSPEELMASAKAQLGGAGEGNEVGGGPDDPAMPVKPTGTLKLRAVK